MSGGADRVFSETPANRFLGLRLVSRSSEESTVVMEVAASHTQETGVVHGGLLSALADTAAVYCFYPDLPAAHTMTSIEFKINFLRPALVERGQVSAHARVLRRGRKVGVCDVEVTQAGAIVAKGLFTYLFFEREGEK